MGAAMKTWDFGKAASYPFGPWSGEPDKAQWIDEATGLDCLIVRGPVGALCGYVGVPPEHPWHGKGYSESLCGHSGCYEHTPDKVDIHGGLTYADACCESEDGSGICHVPEPGRPANVWWFGFDCAHAGDVTPALLDGLRRIPRPAGDVYRSIDYVRRECASLASQLAAVGR